MRFGKGLSVVVLVGLVAALAGCEHEMVQATEQYPAAPANSISVYQLAGRINCQVTKSTPACATLANQCNSVTIFSDPGGAIYVNGQSVSRQGQIARVGGTIFLSESVEEQIRPLLRGEAVPTYPPRPMPPSRTPVAGAPVSPRHSHVSAVVVLDPGHGGKDAGCIACNGTYEKNIVLPIALEVRRRLMDSGVKVIMTRSTDEFIELDERAQIANRAGADMFVAIHADSTKSNSSATGHTVYVAPGATQTVMTMARSVDRDMEQRGLASRGLRHARYRVLVNTSCPAMLVEVGYLSNRGEAGQLCSTAYRNQVADAIAEGILDALRQR